MLLPTKAGDRWFPFSGIVIPWTDGARLTRVKLRRIDGGTPKYAEAFAARPLIYPDPAAVRPGQKLIICEGELDCLLLAQQLPEACVITLGSAAARTDPDVFVKLLSAARWFVAHDADRAGDAAAAKFPARRGARPAPGALQRPERGARRRAQFHPLPMGSPPGPLQDVGGVVSPALGAASWS